MTLIKEPHVHEHEEKHKQHQGMQHMAAEVVEHYTEPSPMVTEAPEFFPAAVMNGLTIGAAVGALLGFGLGYLLREFIIVVPGWEGLFSMETWTFLVFFTLIGSAIGLFVIGSATVLFTPAKTTMPGQPIPRAKALTTYEEKAVIATEETAE
ncbi:MAG: hypothetical protein K8I82_01520 [Anaerolineae bacterium]|nr:hypothetical protein [Anaerolineae bacterium]